ncbi:MAG: hypothetical protein AAB214_10745, partial [Fibrobacterota bacterium]
LSLRLPVRYGNYMAALAVDLGAGQWLFLPHDDAAKLEVTIDREEFEQAWKNLGGGDLRLVAGFKFNKELLLEEGTEDNEWIRPTLALAKGKLQVALDRSRWSAPTADLPNAADDRKRFLLSRTWQAGKLARAGKLATAGWIEVTRDLLNNPEVLAEKAVWLVYVANELLNASSFSKDEKTSRLMVDFWTNELHTKVRAVVDVELTKASSILSSNSLGNAVSWRDTALCQRILDELVDKDQESIQHGTLHYNLSCYYAWRKDRLALLAAVRRAREHGKPASQFRDDPDFGPWLSDADFVKALGAEQ